MPTKVPPSLGQGAHDGHRTVPLPAAVTRRSVRAGGRQGSDATTTGFASLPIPGSMASTAARAPTYSTPAPASLCSPMADIPEGDLHGVKVQYPHVYGALLQYERLLKHATANLVAKEQELRRCIDVGQEVLGQLELVRHRCAELATERDELLGRIEATPMQPGLTPPPNATKLPLGREDYEPRDTAVGCESFATGSKRSPSKSQPSPPPALPPPPTPLQQQELSAELERARESARVAQQRRAEAEERRRHAESLSEGLEQRFFDSQREIAMLRGEVSVKNARIDELLRRLGRGVEGSPVLLRGLRNYSVSPTRADDRVSALPSRSVTIRDGDCSHVSDVTDERLASLDPDLLLVVRRLTESLATVEELAARCTGNSPVSCSSAARAEFSLAKTTADVYKQMLVALHQLAEFVNHLRRAVDTLDVPPKQRPASPTGRNGTRCCGDGSDIQSRKIDFSDSDTVEGSIVGSTRAERGGPPEGPPHSKDPEIRLLPSAEKQRPVDSIRFRGATGGPLQAILAAENAHLRHELSVTRVEVTMLRKELDVTGGARLPDQTLQHLAAGQSSWLGARLESALAESSTAAVAEASADAVTGDAKRDLRRPATPTVAVVALETPVEGREEMSLPRQRQRDHEEVLRAQGMPPQLERDGLIQEYERVIADLRGKLRDARERGGCQQGAAATDGAAVSRDGHDRYLPELGTEALSLHRSELRTLRCERDKLEGDVEELSGRLVAEEATRAALDDQVRQLREANDALTDAISKSRVEYQRVLRANRDTQEEMIRAAEKATLEQLQRQDVERERDGIACALKSLRHETQQIQIELAAVTADEQRSSRLLNERLERLSSENASLKQRLQQLELETETYVEKLYSAEETIRALELELESANDRCRDLDRATVPVAMFEELERDYQQLEQRLKATLPHEDAYDRRCAELVAECKASRQRVFSVRNLVVSSPPPQLALLDSLARELRTACRAVPRWFPGVDVAAFTKTAALAASAATPGGNRSPGNAPRGAASMSVVNGHYVLNGSDSESGSSEASFRRCGAGPSQEAAVGFGDHDGKVRKDREESVPPSSVASTVSPLHGKDLPQSRSPAVGGDRDPSMVPVSDVDQESREFGAHVLHFLTSLFAEVEALAQLSHLHWDCLTTTVVSAAAAASIQAPTASPRSDSAAKPARPAGAGPCATSEAALATPPCGELPTEPHSVATPSIQRPLLSGDADTTSHVAESGALPIVSRSSATQLREVGETEVSEAYGRLRRQYKRCRALALAHNHFCEPAEECDGAVSSRTPQMHSSGADLLHSPSRAAASSFLVFVERVHELWSSANDALRKRESASELTSEKLQRRTAFLENERRGLEKQVADYAEREVQLRQQLLDAQENVLRTKEEVHRLQSQQEAQLERMQEDRNVWQAHDNAVRRQQVEWEAERRRWKAELAALTAQHRQERQLRLEAQQAQQHDARQARMEIDAALERARVVDGESRRVDLAGLESDNERLQAEVLELKKRLHETQRTLHQHVMTLQEVRREFTQSNQNFLTLLSEHQEQERKARDTIGTLERDLATARAAMDVLQQSSSTTEAVRLEELKRLLNTSYEGEAETPCAGEVKAEDGSTAQLAKPRGGLGDAERQRLHKEIVLLTTMRDAERGELLALRAANHVLENRLAEVEGDREPLRQQLHSMLLHS